jgi:hypothetical protein
MELSNKRPNAIFILSDGSDQEKFKIGTYAGSWKEFEIERISLYPDTYFCHFFIMIDDAEDIKEEFDELYIFSISGNSLSEWFVKPWGKSVSQLEQMLEWYKMPLSRITNTLLMIIYRVQLRLTCDKTTLIINANHLIKCIVMEDETTIRYQTLTEI